MATAKKAAVKKAAPKKTVVKKRATVRVAKPKEMPTEAVKAEPPVTDTAVPTKRRGRPAGSTGRKNKKNKAGRRAALEFLYSIRPLASNDDLGLGDDDESPKAQAIVYVGPFASEKEATDAALEEIDGKKDVEVVLFRDFRRGRIETKTRIVG